MQEVDQEGKNFNAEGTEENRESTEYPPGTPRRGAHRADARRHEECSFSTYMSFPEEHRDVVRGDLTPSPFPKRKGDKRSPTHMSLRAYCAKQSPTSPREVPSPWGEGGGEGVPQRVGAAQRPVKGEDCPSPGPWWRGDASWGCWRLLTALHSTHAILADCARGAVQVSS
jgi:hypothetical protein